MVKEKDIVKLIDEDLESSLTELFTARKVKEVYERKEKVALQSVKAELGKYTDEFPDEKLQFGSLEVNVISSTRRGISIQKLLEKGVSPAIIEECATYSEVTSIRVQEIQEEA
jgi:hypothetical protein